MNSGWRRSISESNWLDEICLIVDQNENHFLDVVKEIRLRVESIGGVEEHLEDLEAGEVEELDRLWKVVGATVD
ncbi:hypothetical protein U1Q18_023113 [Sarracenia purpurea var. burkii]